MLLACFLYFFWRAGDPVLRITAGGIALFPSSLTIKRIPWGQIERFDLGEQGFLCIKLREGETEKVSVFDIREEDRAELMPEIQKEFAASRSAGAEDRPLAPVPNQACRRLVCGGLIAAVYLICIWSIVTYPSDIARIRADIELLRAIREPVNASKAPEPRFGKRRREIEARYEVEAAPLVDGRKNGLERFYETRGGERVLILDVPYRNGREHGLLRIFDGRSGRLIANMEMIEGLAHGAEREYDLETGELLMTWQYVEGKLVDE